MNTLGNAPTSVLTPTLTARRQHSHRATSRPFPAGVPRLQRANAFHTTHQAIHQALIQHTNAEEATQQLPFPIHYVCSMRSVDVPRHIAPDARPVHPQSATCEPTIETHMVYL